MTVEELLKLCDLVRASEEEPATTHNNHFGPASLRARNDFYKLTKT